MTSNHPLSIVVRLHNISKLYLSLSLSKLERRVGLSEYYVRPAVEWRHDVTNGLPAQQTAIDKRHPGTPVTQSATVLARLIDRYRRLNLSARNQASPRKYLRCVLSKFNDGFEVSMH